MVKDVRDLEELKEYFDSRILAIPELQRYFVWNNSRLRDLADSIFKKYSIGAFTIWDAPPSKVDLLRHSKGYLPPYYPKSNTRIHYVIDGQQRLVVLYSFLRPEGLEITNYYGQKFNSRNVCFSINKDQDGLNFIYAKKGPDNKRYFSLCDILDKKYKERFHFLLKKKQRVKFGKIKECRNRFLSYRFRFIYTKEDNKKNTLRETFIRLNTRGLTLKAADRAFTYASDVRMREFFDRLKERLGVLKTISDAPIQEVIYMIYRSKEGAIRFNSRSIDTVFKKINDSIKERERFKKDQPRIQSAIEYGEQFLKSQGVVSLDYLPSQTMVAVLSTFYYNKKSNKIRPHIEKKLKKWFWYSAIAGRYSGKGYLKYAAKDCQVMESLADGKKKEFEEFAKQDIDILNTALYYTRRSSLVRAFYCLLELQKPREFFNWALEIDLKQPTYKERKQNHHIFPEELMKNIVSKNRYNSIINICFLPQQTNSSFSGAPPYEYLDSKDIDKDNLNKILKSHLIPPMIKKRTTDIKKQFNKFYDARKELIIKTFEKEAGTRLFEESA